MTSSTGPDGGLHGGKAERVLSAMRKRPNLTYLPERQAR